MAPYGPGTRVAMVVVGAVWAAAGAGWLYVLDPALWFDEDVAPFGIPTTLFACGLLLVGSGVKPARPKTFEEEVPDAHPDLDDD